MSRPPLNANRGVVLLALLAAVGGADAARAPGIDGVRFSDVRTVRYQCDGDRMLTVRYFNSADNQAAVFRLDGKPVLAVTTVSASGALCRRALRVVDQGRYRHAARPDAAGKRRAGAVELPCQALAGGHASRPDPTPTFEATAFRAIMRD